MALNNRDYLNVIERKIIDELRIYFNGVDGSATNPKYSFQVNSLSQRILSFHLLYYNKSAVVTKSNLSAVVLLWVALLTLVRFSVLVF